MKKMYKCVKEHPHIKQWVPSDEYELDDADALEYVEKGFLQEVTLDDQERLINKVLAKVRTQQVADDVARATDIMTEVMKRVPVYAGANVSGGQGPLRFAVERDDRDKRKNLRDLLGLVGMTGMDDSPNRRDMAREEIYQVYALVADETFDERWRKAQGAADDVVVKQYLKEHGLENRMTVAEYRKAALAEGSGTAGGYTVPPEYAMELLAIDPEDAVMAGRTDDYALLGRELIMPTLNQTTATGTAGRTPFFGQMYGQWTGEAATRNESEPTFGEAKMVANEFAGFALASNNLILDNKVALEQRLTRLFRDLVTWYRDFAYLQGDGVAKPRGVMNAPATLTVTRAGADAIAYADITTMLGKLLPQSWKTAYWVLQQSALTSMLQMVDPGNRLVIQPYYSSTAGPAAVRPVLMMLGLPVKVTEKTSTLGTAGDLMLIDPKQYFTATRQDVEIAASMHYKFANNQMAYRYIFRGDGQPWMPAPITLQDQTTKISPFVKLV